MSLMIYKCSSTATSIFTDHEDFWRDEVTNSFLNSRQIQPGHVLTASSAGPIKPRDGVFSMYSRLPQGSYKNAQCFLDQKWD
jgi:hypothetical protein